MGFSQLLFTKHKFIILHEEAAYSGFFEEKYIFPSNEEESSLVKQKLPTFIYNFIVSRPFLEYHLIKRVPVIMFKRNCYEPYRNLIWSFIRIKTFIFNIYLLLFNILASFVLLQYNSL